ncbi:MAG: hypothetical protein HUJ76_12395, partial [Parasporobacterium sp.]|nr:hypothetical protein [Parasporobacterium sp.]
MVRPDKYVSSIGKWYFGPYDPSGYSAPVIRLAAAAIAVKNDKTGAKITWNAVDNASKYYIYRKTSSSGWTLIKATTELSYIDTTAAAGTAYQYCINAMDSADGAGPDSNIVTNAFVGYTACKVKNTASGVTISWSKTTGATGYRIYYRADSSASWKGWKNVAATSVTDSFAAGKYYEYLIRPYVTTGGTTYYGYWDNTLSDGVIRLAAPAITVKNAADGVNISWK